MPFPPRTSVDLKEYSPSKVAKRYIEEHFVAAQIDEHGLQAALARSGLNASALQPKAGDGIAYLILDRLECLHWLHRARAAEAHLNPNDRRWFVRLFRAG